MKKYIEIYEYYRSLITNGQMKSGDKMPSIRSATSIFSVSKTTIENAYFELQADGYIISSPKSGYYVSDYTPIDTTESKVDTESKHILYDLKSGDADKDSFDISLWQRYIKSALRQQDRLLSYSDNQGEADLREALAKYIREKRNVTTSPDRIVVGAGVQNLLGILCSLIDDRDTVSFPDKSFVQGMSVFKDYGFEVKTRDKNAKVIYVSPSHMTSYGDVMKTKRRLELVKHSEINHILVIEDDYDNDFLYQSKPTPSLFALSGCGNVVYMGSFSNVLIPGIRISFMVLTKELTEKYKKNIDKYAQAASKTEQIALCQYIRDGHINSQTRRIRRLYTAKTKQFYDEIKKQIKSVNCKISDNGLQIKIEAPPFDTKKLADNGIALHIKEVTETAVKLVIVPSAIDVSDIPHIVSLLKKSIE